MSSSVASDLSRRLAQDAEAVCRYYLSNGRRHGRYWIVGDARNTPGRSLFVRLTGPESGKGAAGNWTDASTNEFGDLLDIVRESAGLNDFSDVLDEARRFLSLPRAEPRPKQRLDPRQQPTGSPDSARHLFPCHGRSPAHWPSAICIIEGSRRRRILKASVFIRAATIDPGTGRPLKPGPR